MSTENIDDLFRRQLGEHATPPGNELWARLQAGPDATPASPKPAATATPERVDQFYQHRLGTHATPPSRQVWERLEDEHLRPRQRRAVAWWPMALAAAVALLLLAGGAGLWRGRFSSGRGPAGQVASQSGGGRHLPAPTRRPAGHQAEIPTTEKNSQTVRLNATQADLAANAATPATTATRVAAAAEDTAGTAAAYSAESSIARAPETTNSGFKQKNLPGRATRSAGPASSASKGGLVAQRPARRPREASQSPDVAVAAAPLVARPTAQPHASTGPADEPAPAVAATNLPASATTPATEIVPAAPAAASLATATLITVDVRHGAARRPSLATAVASAAAAATEERRGLGGRLLRQVGHAVRGERLSLAEVTGLPENLTLEATIAGRRVSKSIQL